VPEPRALVAAIPPAVAAPPPPEPTIHVTIGRVEVRATPPAAADAPAPAAPAVVGLDDYLRRRGGGGRP
jgi:hypothetical protein